MRGRTVVPGSSFESAFMSKKAQPRQRVSVRVSGTEVMVYNLARTPITVELLPALDPVPSLAAAQELVDTVGEEVRRSLDTERSTLFVLREGDDGEQAPTPPVRFGNYPLVLIGSLTFWEALWGHFGLSWACGGPVWEVAGQSCLNLRASSCSVEGNMQKM